MTKTAIIFLILLLAGSVFAALPEPNSYFTMNDSADSNAVLNDKAVTTGTAYASLLVTATDANDANARVRLYVKEIGTNGNNLRFQLIAGTEGTVAVSGSLITVARGLVFTYSLTATELKTAIDGNAAASALVSCLVDSNGTGNGNVKKPVAATFFTGGEDSILPPHGVYHGYDVVTDYNTFVYDSNNGASLAAHQGVAYDGTSYYIIHTNWVKKYSKSWVLEASNLNVFTQARAILAETDGNYLYSHLGDGAVYDGVLYIPMEYWNSVFYNQRIIRLQTSDLTVIGCNDISDPNYETAGVYVDDDYVYMVSYLSGGSDKIHRYNRSDLSYANDITLSAAIATTQGITSDGEYFYISTNTGNVVKRVSLTGTVGSTMYTFSTYIEGLCWLPDQNKMAVFHDAGSSIGRVHFLKYEDYNVPTITANRSVAGAAADTNTALSFNGITDYIQLSSTPMYDALQGGKITVNLWFSSTDTGGGFSLLGFNSGGGGFSVGYDEDIMIRFSFNDGNEVVEDTTNWNNANNVPDWFMLTIAAEQTTATDFTTNYYINGVKDGQSGLCKGILANMDSATEYIGSGGGGYYEGSLDDIRFYDEVLSGQEIAILYLDTILGEGDYLTPANVRYGTIYEVNDVNLTGTLDLPSVNDVRYGVSFDSASQIGTYKGKRWMGIW